MTDVSDLAKREADLRDWELSSGRAFVDGAEHMAALLLSDEAVEAAAELFYTVQTGTVGKYRTSIYKEAWDTSARAALQAALTAITTNPETPISETGEQ